MWQQSTDDLFYDLQRRVGAHPDRKGEVHTTCPSCGKEAKRGQVHFSFSKRGGCCFVCGYRVSLPRLAEVLGIERNAPFVPMPRPKPKPQPVRDFAWKHEPHLLDRFQPVPTFAREYLHTRGLTDRSVERWHIGYGVLPASRCRFPRIVLPIFSEHRLVGLRGRQILPEDTEAKWLQSAGSETVLFGADELRERSTVIVTEAPFSAILAMQEAPAVSAVAICGAGIWREEWTERIARARPTMVLVWLDCDEAGMKGGVKIVNQLLEAGVRARMYHWPTDARPKSDLADVVVSCRGRGA